MEGRRGRRIGASGGGSVGIVGFPVGGGMHDWVWCGVRVCALEVAAVETHETRSWWWSSPTDLSGSMRGWRTDDVLGGARPW